MGENIDIYTLYTLVDITPTGVTRGPDSLRRDQQRNWETVIQAIGLVAQPTEVNGVELHDEMPLEWANFGEFYQGKHTVWTWRFAVDTAMFLKKTITLWHGWRSYLNKFLL